MAVRSDADFFVYFVGVLFLCGNRASIFSVGPSRKSGGICVRSRKTGYYRIPWRIIFCVKTILRHCAGLERQRASTHRKRMKALRNTRRSRPSPNDDPCLCAIFDTADGVGELYQRRSTFCYGFVGQTTTPSGSGTSGGGWKPLRP
jgi:hypothetical protein